MLDDAKKFAVTRSKPMIAVSVARMVNAQTMVPEIYDIPKLAPYQLVSLKPTYVLFSINKWGLFEGLGL